MSLNNKMRDKKLASKNNYSDHENDDLNIKLHLNTSFDLSGINVSEELINKTLEAIKEREPEKQREQKINRKLSIYKNAYRIAGACAAVLVVAAGIHFMGTTGGKKADLNNSNLFVAFDTSLDASSNTTGNSAEKKDGNAGAASVGEKEMQSSSETPKEAEQPLFDDTALSSAEADNVQSEYNFKSTLQGNADASVVEGTDNSGTEASSDIKTEAGNGMKSASQGSEIESSKEEAADNREMAAADQGTRKDTNDANKKDAVLLFRGVETDDIAFRDIFLADPQQAEYIQIKDVENNSVIQLKSQEQIIDFYSIMEKYKYSKGTDAPVTQSYVIEVKSQQTEEVLYTLEIGDAITISKEAGDEISEMNYMVDDEEALIQSINSFYLRNAK